MTLSLLLCDPDTLGKSVSIKNVWTGTRTKKSWKESSKSEKQNGQKQRTKKRIIGNVRDWMDREHLWKGTAGNPFYWPWKGVELVPLLYCQKSSQEEIFALCKKTQNAKIS